MPNLALAIGYTNASWTLKCDLTCDYVCRLLNHMRERGLTQCVARNRDDSAASGPILGLTSGYIQRSAHLLPKQGTKHPWKVHQSYLRDYRALKMSDIDDTIMEFSGSSTHGEATRASGLLRRARDSHEGFQQPRRRHHRGGLGHRAGARAARWRDRERIWHSATSTKLGWPKRWRGARASGSRSRRTRLDVADRDAVYAWADAVVAEHGRVNLVVQQRRALRSAPRSSQCPTRTSNG